MHNEEKMGDAPLSGLKVLDMSRVLAGPLCAQILADLGAEVIKIERPGGGDDSRQWKKSNSQSSVDELNSSIYFWSFNRGKKSLTLDISNPEDQKKIVALAGTCDILIENYKVDTLKKYGLDYASLAELNKRLIYCSITGFGQYGPYRHRPGYDSIIQAMGGLMSITGFPDEEGGRPTKTGIAISDQLTALYAAVAILAALAERAGSGEGQHIDLALLDVQVAALSNLGMNYLNENRETGRIGNGLATVSPTDCYACQDGDIMIIIGNDAQFASFCRQFDRHQWLEDERFSTNSARLVNKKRLNEQLSLLFGQIDTGRCLRMLESAGVPASRINNFREVFSDEHVKAREMVRTVEAEGGKTYKVIRNPIVMSRSTIRYQNAAPDLGNANAMLDKG